jgi:hypothetical protein
MAKKRKKKRKSGARAAEPAEPSASSAPEPQQRAQGGAQEQARAARTPARGAAATTTDRTDDGAPPVSRAAANTIIALFLLFAIAMPARYYLTGGGLDERFAWRMFSTVRQYACQVQVYDKRRAGGVVEVNLTEVVHMAWVNMLKRGRPAVGDKILRARCEAGDNVEAQLQRTCTTPDGSALPPAVYTIDCDSGAIEERESPEASP